MIVGSGMMATAFERYRARDDVLIFASGVSNSDETLEAVFTRERDLLQQTARVHSKPLFLYFSTCSITDPSVAYRPYIQHKLKMESLVRDSTRQHLICRLPNIVGRGGNPHTVLNFLFDAIKTGRPFQVWKHASRNILGVDDVASVVDEIIFGMNNRTLNIANTKSFPVVDIVSEIEAHLGRPARVSLEDRGAPVEIDVREISHILRRTLPDGHAETSYVRSLLERYYR